MLVRMSLWFLKMESDIKFVQKAVQMKSVWSRQFLRQKSVRTYQVLQQL